MSVTDSDAVRRALAEMGPRYASDISGHSQQVKALYAPLLRARSTEGIEVFRGIAYGPDPQQVMDVFRPEGVRNADVVVFVHGGAFVRGARSAPEGVYDNVLRWFARQGWVGVNMDYRLAPQAAYPCGGQDVAAALAHVEQHIEAYGGNPRRILLVGHSAGGTHAATYACDPVIELPCRARALVLISARLRADRSARNPNAQAVAAYFGDNVNLYDARSPVSHAARCPVPVMLAFAQYENPLLDIYALEFAQRIAERDGVAPRVLQCMGHNHMSVMAHFDTEEETLGRAMLDFWASID